MSGNTPNSWEDAAGDDSDLAKQAQQQLNFQQSQQQSQQQHQQQQQQQRQPRPPYNAPAFSPGATSFTPGVPAFVPGGAYSGQQQLYGAYNQGPQQYSQYGQYGAQHGYDQYAQYSGYNAGYGQQQAAYGQQPGQFYNPQQPQQQQAYRPPHAQRQQQQQQQQSSQTIKTPSSGTATSISQLPATASPKPVISPMPAAPPKVLKIGGEPLGARVLTIGGASSGASTPPKKEATTPKDASTNKPEVGSKVAANKAVSASTPINASPAPSGGKSPAPTPVDAAAQKREVDAVAKEQEEEVDDSTLEELYGKEHVNLIFIGHVDAGKSSLGGAILYATGMVDERTMDKYKREAKEQGRESWYLSWALDLTKEERSKGKTVEVGRAYFETEKRRYTILDAPGHKTFVPSMIGGASQADVGILVISARKGEYETGFEKGGQTREHAVLAKTQGVNKLIVVVNKMDDPTVEWSKDRFTECTAKLTQFLKATGYKNTDLMFMPLSALTGAGLDKRVPKSVCPWYDGPSLLEYLDDMKTLERKLKAPFMMPIISKYRDMGTIIEGKVESGFVMKGGNLLMMPGRTPIEVVAIYSETEEEVSNAQCGDQVRIRVKGVEEEDVVPGFVLTSKKNPIHCVTTFEAQIHILELKNILTAGFSCVMHVHTTIQEVNFAALLHKLEKGTGRKSKKPPPFANKGQAIIARLETTNGESFPIERFEDYQQLGRFTLRDQGQTIAIGKVTRLISE